MFTPIDMSFDSRAIANHFLRVAAEDGKHLENMKLQKLLYYAHGHWLAEKGEPLLDEAIQAWRWGPVVQTVYDEFKRYGNGSITTRAVDYDGTIPRLPRDEQGEEVRAFVKRVYDAYKRFSGSQLANKTHETDTPWSQLSRRYGGRLPYFLSIPDDDIEDYFKEHPLPEPTDRVRAE